MTEIELFLDRHRISWEHNVDRHLNHPAKYEGNPILEPRHPWEDSYVTVYGSVLARGGGGFGLWYMAGARGMQADQMMCYAESDDGLTYRRVMSRANPYPGAAPTNIVLGPEPNVHGPCVIENQHSDDPSVRYLLLYDSYPTYRPELAETLQGSRWCYSATSADGLTWTPRLGRPAIAGKSDIGQCVVWDQTHRRYIAYLRGTRGTQVSPASVETQRVRYVRAAWSNDFLHWSEPVETFRCDEQDGDPHHQAHQLSVTRRGDQFVGILSIFRIEQFIPMPRHKLVMEEGPIQTQLVVSRDGLDWRRVADRQEFLLRGGAGQWDSYWLVTADRIVYDDKRMLIYYAASSARRCDLPHYNPGSPPGARYRIGAATLPRDRFQALRPRRLFQPAVLETKPLAFQPGELRLNADASLGRITVELCDFNGQTIEGFSQADCTPVARDDLEQVVRWRGRPLSDAVDPSKVFQRRIRVRFYLHHASLFAAHWPLAEEEVA